MEGGVPCLICKGPSPAPVEGEVIFVLRQVLQVPDSLFAQILKGEETVGCLALCGNCRQVVGGCQAVHEKLCNLQRKWNECRARVIDKIRVTAAGEEDAPGGEDAMRLETRRFVVNHVYAFSELIGGEEAAEGENVSPTTTNEDDVVASAAGDGLEFLAPAQAAGEISDVSKTHEIVAVTPTGGRGESGVAVNGPVRKSKSLRNGSSEEVGGQDQTLETSRDTGNERDEGQEKVALSPGNIPRPIPQTRHCSVLLQRIQVPREGGGKTRVPEARAEEEDVDIPGGRGDVSTTREIGGVTGSRGEIEVASGHGRIVPARRNEIRRGHEKHARSLLQKVACLECLFCQKKFQHNAHLLTHMRVHTGERPFWCGVCGKEFNCSGHLNSHRLTHTGEKPYLCELCPKRFAHSSDLSRHVRAHLGEKSWKCPDCGKAFVRQDTLTAHRVVHTGEKPFKCNLCPKKYSQLCGPSAHKKKKH